MRIKHTGQMPCPTNPHHNAGAHHASCAKQAVAALALETGRGHAMLTELAKPTVTVRRRRTPVKA